MMDLEFSFEEAPWEAFLRTKQMGDTVTAGSLLALLEGEEEESLLDALDHMEQACMHLSVEDLPRPALTGEAALRLRQETELARRGIRPELLEEGDPLRLYLEELAMIPAWGEEDLLAADCAVGNEEKMVQLTNLGLSRVVELSGDYVGYGVLLMDLIQEGSLGLWQAVRSYSRGAYGAWRDRWIRFYLARAVTLHARAMGAGQRMRSALEDYRQVDERLLGELGRNPTLEEIAMEMHISPEMAFTVKKMLSDARLMAQTRKSPEPEEEEPQEEDQAVENTALFQMRQRILDLLSVLSPEDSRLLTLRFGLEGQLPLSPEETGRILGLTAQEVVAREAAALAQLRGS